MKDCEYLHRRKEIDAESKAKIKVLNKEFLEQIQNRLNIGDIAESSSERIIVDEILCGYSLRDCELPDLIYYGRKVKKDGSLYKRTGTARINHSTLKQKEPRLVTQAGLFMEEGEQ